MAKKPLDHIKAFRASKDGKRIEYPITNLSAGEQSILNMLIQSM